MRNLELSRRTFTTLVGLLLLVSTAAGAVPSEELLPVPEGPAHASATVARVSPLDLDDDDGDDHSRHVPVDAIEEPPTCRPAGPALREARERFLRLPPVSPLPSRGPGPGRAPPSTPSEL